jgi:hypothetical protein
MFLWPRRGDAAIAPVVGGGGPARVDPGCQTRQQE